MRLQTYIIVLPYLTIVLYAIFSLYYQETPVQMAHTKDFPYYFSLKVKTEYLAGGPRRKDASIVTA